MQREGGTIPGRALSELIDERQREKNGPGPNEAHGKEEVKNDLQRFPRRVKQAPRKQCQGGRSADSQEMHRQGRVGACPSSQNQTHGQGVVQNHIRLPRFPEGGVRARIEEAIHHLEGQYQVYFGGRRGQHAFARIEEAVSIGPPPDYSQRRARRKSTPVSTDPVPHESSGQGRTFRERKAEQV